MHYFLDLLEAQPAAPIRSRADLRFYQHWMVDQIKGRGCVLLAAEMGLGKTIASLTAIVDLIAQRKVRRVLIVAPLLVARETWPTEIQEWAHTRHLDYAVVAGTEEERFAALERKATIDIINRENLVWLWRCWGHKWPYDMLVYDEASRLKGGMKRTKPSKRVRKDGTVKPGRSLSEFGVLARARGLMKFVVELSGTPAPNGLIDLWGPIYIIDRGERLGTSKSAYEKRWFITDKYSSKVEPREFAHAQIMERVSDVMISLKEEDYLTLPPRVDNKIYVTFPPSLMKSYKKFERTLYAEEYDVEALSQGVLTNKLLQWANGSIYNDEKEALFVHDLKLKAMDSVVEEAAGAPLLVAYSFKFDLAALRKRYPKAVVLREDPDAIKRWNRGEIEMLLTHPASAGHGLNLQHGGSIACWYGLTWSLEYYQQFVKRLHRSGQKAERVMMHHILARGTADEDVMRVIGSKGATQDRITDVVRQRLRAA